MKLIYILALVIAPLTLLAQANTIDGSPETSVDWWARVIVMESPSVSNDNLVRGGVAYSGIGVQLIQAEQPLQLLNPLAPQRYGTGEPNVILDVFTKQPVGLKLFSINF